MKAYIVNAFVKNGKGGNPAGVVLNADDLSSNQKQQIAARIGYSETAFVSRSGRADFLLEFYTPNKQIPHCGHATIASFSLMNQLGMIKSDEAKMATIAGTNSVFRKSGMIFMEQQSPRYIEVKNGAAVLQSLSLNKKDTIAEPLVVNTGNSFLLLEVQDAQTLAAIKTDEASVNEISAQYDLIGYYIFSRTNASPADATTRMFAPYYAISEEAATGMAAGPLACYLHDVAGIQKDQFLFYQGFFMEPPSPSEIIVSLNLKESKIQSLLAGGDAAVIREIEV
jgi:PhzF family phenazine biosynthesis protein